MLTKPVLVTLVTSLMFCSGCAAKNRWFSRRDYSEMQDPFMQSDAVASVGEADGQSPDPEGRARVDGLTADAGSSAKQPGVARLPGPKAIRPRGVDRESKTPSGRIANASYPQDDDAATSESNPKNSEVRSWEGPALSDFINRKSAESAQAAAATRAASATQAAAATQGSAANRAGETAAAASRRAEPALSRAARVAPDPKVSDEAAGFGSFLQQKSGSLNAASEKSVQSVSEKTVQSVSESEDSVTDFAAWAQQRQEKWTEEGTAVASEAMTSANDDINAFAQETQDQAVDGLSDFHRPNFEMEELAQPLIDEPRARQPVSPDAEGAVAAFEQSPEAAEAEPNPFENPFEFDAAPVDAALVAAPPVAAAPVAAEPVFAEPLFAEPVAATPTPVKSPKPAAKPQRTEKALDDSFQIDNGWKPAFMTRP